MHAPSAIRLNASAHVSRTHSHLLTPFSSWNVELLPIADIIGSPTTLIFIDLFILSDAITGKRQEPKRFQITGIGMKFAANTNDSVKRRVLRVRLIHARNCIRKSGSAACGRKFCAPMRRILAHAEGCRQSGCAEDNCAETQRIIGHWQECAGDSCSICEPSKIEVKPSTEGNTFDEVVCILDESSPVDRPIERPPPKLEISEPDASDENAPAGQSTHGECDAGGATDSWNDFVQMISELSSKDNQIEKVRLYRRHMIRIWSRCQPMSFYIL